ncbi:MAG: 4-(cytidine 5'-diphospho)-2-C-methyl-D-erythritol kinase [Spirochaetaceae bacterium]
MNIEYRIKSPCKINLHLEVHNKRDDGFHNLTSIFQLISLEDEICVKKNSNNEVNIFGDFDCKKEDNLIYKAVILFFETGNISGGLDFYVKKNVPSGGGIGGGSSNCAATLKLLDYIFPGKVTTKQLSTIALSLGSDVPFFLGSGSALVRGRGEIIKSIDTISDYSLIIINPSIHISTSKAFKLLSQSCKLEDENRDNTDKILSLYNSGYKYFSEFKNSFEIALQSDYTFVNDIKNSLLSCGAVHAGLSGSGSTMFGVFKDIEGARKAKDLFAGYKTYKFYIVKPLVDYPKVKEFIF